MIDKISDLEIISTAANENSFQMAGQPFHWTRGVLECTAVVYVSGNDLNDIGIVFVVHMFIQDGAQYCFVFCLHSCWSGSRFRSAVVDCVL